MTIHVLEVARGEALDAAAWYDRKQPGLGSKFLDEIDEALEKIERNPQGSPLWELYSGSREIRRCLLNRFPYGVIFICNPADTRVIAIAHVRRRPLY